MTNSLRRFVIWGFLLLVAASGITYLLWPRPVPVDLTVLQNGPLVVSVNEEGKTRIKEIYEVSTPVMGRILRVEREAGDTAVANQTIIAQLQPIDPEFLDLRTEAEIRSTIQASQAARNLAEAAVTKVRAELSFAETDLTRIKRLAGNETVSERRLDEAELAFDTKKAELATALATLDIKVHELERAKSQLISPAELITNRDACACIPLLAPANGKILRVLEENEGVLPAGTVIAEVGDPTDLEIVVDLLSSDAVSVSEGQRVLIEDWGGEKPLEGIVSRVEPFGFTKISALGIEEQRVNVLIDLTSPPEAYRRLAHGFRVETSIILWQGDNVPTLPLTSLFRDGENWAVYSVENGRTVLTHVETGKANGLTVEIAKGLKEGATVLAHPGNQIENGMAVAAR